MLIERTILIYKRDKHVVGLDYGNTRYYLGVSLNKVDIAEVLTIYNDDKPIIDTELDLVYNTFIKLVCDNKKWKKIHDVKEQVPKLLGQE